MIYSFGQYKLDTKRRQFYSSGEPVGIQPRVYQLIQLLVEHREEALDKNTIQEAIWPGQILSETSLSRLVMKARKALSDNPDDPKYIKTLHGYGFQFLAEVDVDQAVIPETQAQKDLKQPTTVTSQQPKNLKTISFVALSLVLIALLIGLYFPKETAGEKPRILVLPIIDNTVDDDNDWIALGIPSLVTTMLEQTDEFEIINTKKVSKEHFDYQNNPNFTNDMIVLLKEEYSADQIIYSTIRKQGSQYILNLSVNKNTTQSPIFKLSAKEPSQLARKIVNKLTNTESDDNRFNFKYTVSSNDFVNTLYGKGQSFLLQGYTQKARDMFKAALAEEPDLFWVRYGYSLTSRKLGLWEQSRDELLMLLKHPNLNQINHGEIKAQNVLGFTYFRLRDFDKAFKAYERAYQLSEQQGEFRLQAGITDNVGALHWFNYQFDEARVWLTRGIAIRKKLSILPTGHTYNLLGLLERDQGNLLAAKIQLSKSARLFGEAGMIRDYTMTQLNLSTIDEHMGNYDDALSRIKESQENFKQLKEKEGIPFLHRQFANLYLAKGNTQLAKTHLSKAMQHAKLLKNAAQIAEVDFILGRVLLAIGDTKKAEPLLLNIIPHYEEVWAPYVPLMQLAIINKNQLNLDHFYQESTKDAKTKGDRLYQLYADVIYELGSSKLVRNERNSLNNNLLALIKKARNMSANKILGQLLIESIEYSLSNNHYDEAIANLQQLEMLFPNWQVAKTIRLYVEFFVYEDVSYKHKLVFFKNENPSTWSRKEEEWLSNM